MGNSSSRYEQNMLSNLPPGYIPAYPAVPPYAMKKKGWNPFGKSRKRREEEMKQYYYTTPFVWMYPPGSSYPIPNPIGPSANGGITAGQMPIPAPAAPVIPDSGRYRRRSYDSYEDSEYERDRRYRRQPRRPSYDSSGAYTANPLPMPPRNVLAETPHRRVLSLLPSGGSRHRDFRRDYRDYEPRDYEPRHRRRHTTDHYRGRDDLDEIERDRRRRERDREREREEREREREEREEEELDREEEREEREEEREERREELEERRRLRRTRNMGFDTVATGISNMFSRGPSVRMPEPYEAQQPMRGPTPAPNLQPSSPMPPAGLGVGGFVPSANSSAGPPPPPPMPMPPPSTTPYPYGAGAPGMMPTPNPVTPGVMPSAVIPPMSMPTPNMNGQSMPGGMGGPVIPGQTVPMPGSPYFPQPFAGGGPGLPGTREPILIGEPLQISEYMYPGIPAASDGGPFIYKNEQYPTSLHLFEALKFMPHREDIAREIRRIPDRTDMIQFSERNAAARRTDWDQVALSMMDEALLAKFRYNEILRNKLLETGQRPLEFSDPIDSFWGANYDGTGQNHMGHSLERVRQILFEEYRR